jgi:hypothetical protein
MATTPAWKDITSSKKWASFKPEEQNAVRERWLKEVNAQEPNWTEKQRQSLREGVYKQPQVQQQEVASPTTPTIQEDILQQVPPAQTDLVQPPGKQQPTQQIPEGEQIDPNQAGALQGLFSSPEYFQAEQIKELAFGPGSEEFMETVPGGKSLISSEREKFLDKPFFPKLEMPSKKTIAVGVAGVLAGRPLHVIEKRLAEDREAESKLEAVGQEIYKGFEWAAFGAGLKFGSAVLKSLPRIEKILRYPLETLLKRKKTITKEIDAITKSASKGALNELDKKLIDDLGEIKEIITTAHKKRAISDKQLDKVESIMGAAQDGKITLEAARSQIHKVIRGKEKKVEKGFRIVRKKLKEGERPKELPPGKERKILPPGKELRALQEPPRRAMPRRRKLIKETFKERVRKQEKARKEEINQFAREVTKDYKTLRKDQKKEIKRIIEEVRLDRKTIQEGKKAIGKIKLAPKPKTELKKPTVEELKKIEDKGRSAEIDKLEKVALTVKNVPEKKIMEVQKLLKEAKGNKKPLAEVEKEMDKIIFPKEGAVTTSKEAEIKKLVEEAGAEYGTIWEKELSLKKKGHQDQVMFHEPVVHSSLQMPVGEATTVKAIRAKMVESYKLGRPTDEQIGQAIAEGRKIPPELIEAHPEVKKLVEQFTKGKAPTEPPPPVVKSIGEHLAEKRLTTKAKAEPKTVLSEIRSMGGILNTERDVGHLVQKQSGVVGLVTKKGMTWDKMREHFVGKDLFPEHGTLSEFQTFVLEDTLAAKFGKPRKFGPPQETKLPYERGGPTPEMAVEQTAQKEVSGAAKEVPDIRKFVKKKVSEHEKYIEEFEAKGGKIQKIPEVIESESKEVIGKTTAKKARDQSIAEIGSDVSVRKGLKAPGETKTVETIEAELETDGETLGTIIGGVQKFFKRKASMAERGEPTPLQMKRKTSWWDVEKPWQDLGKPEVGRAIKNIYSKMEAVQEWGHGELKKLAKIGQTGKLGVLKRPFKRAKGYTKEDMSDIPLYAEDIGRLKNAPKEVQEKLGEGVKFLRNFFKEAQRRYREYGVNPDFKGNMIDSYNGNTIHMLDTIDKIVAGKITRFTKADLAKLGITIPKGVKFKPKNMKQVSSILSKAMKENKEIVKRLEKLDYVHIPYGMWFEQGMMANRRASVKALSLANLKKRKTITIQDLIDAGAVDKADVNVFDIVMSYSRKMAKDFALLDIRKSAMAEGMVSSKKLPGFERIDPRRAPLFGKDFMHPAFKDWLYDFRVSTVNQTRTDKIFSTIKMWRFAKPLFLMYYDLQQHAVARNVGWLNPVGIGQDFGKALYQMAKKPKSYYEALEHGVSSKPFDLPWKTSMELVEKLKGTTAGDILKGLAKQGKHPLKTTYEALWETAWWGDRFVRLATNNMYLRKGASPWEAAQTAAFIHSDYAGVPMASRRAMQKILFTGTFKVTMGKLYADMIKQMARVPAKLLTGKGKTLTFREKEIAKAGYATAFGAMVGYDTLMTKGFGWKRDQFAIRYYKDVDTPEGPKEVVHVLASPLTLIPKYWSKFQRLMLTDYYSDDKLRGGIETFKWDLHPVHNVAYSLVNNKDQKGDMIVNPIADSPGTKLGKRIRYAVKQSLAVLEYVAGEKDQKQAWKYYQKDVGKLFSWLLSPASFTYLRDPKVERLNSQLHFLKERFQKIGYKMEHGKKQNGEPYTEADFRKFYEQMDKKSEELQKKIIIAEKEHDRTVRKREYREMSRETGRKKKVKTLKAPGSK